MSVDPLIFRTESTSESSQGRSKELWVEGQHRAEVDSGALHNAVEVYDKVHEGRTRHGLEQDRILY